MEIKNARQIQIKCGQAGRIMIDCSIIKRAEDLSTMDFLSQDIFGMADAMHMEPRLEEYILINEFTQDGVFPSNMYFTKLRKGKYGRYEFDKLLCMGVFKELSNAFKEIFSDNAIIAYRSGVDHDFFTHLDEKFVPIDYEGVRKNKYLIGDAGSIRERPYRKTIYRHPSPNELNDSVLLDNELGGPKSFSYLKLKAHAFPDELHEDNIKLVNERIELNTKCAEALGFLDFNFYSGFEHSNAMIYGNTRGNLFVGFTKGYTETFKKNNGQEE